MESYKIRHLNFCYPKAHYAALHDISLDVRRGEFITLCGKSGCGKTTLLRLLKSSLAPHGDLSGEIYFNGKNLGETDAREQAGQIGFIMQSCDNQIVTDKVWHELAFGLESLGYSTSEIRGRVAEMASFFGIETWFHKKVNELSGGQKQLLNLASVMVMQPSVLIADEPTSQLDPISAQEFLKALEKVNHELGTTVILSEHRLDDAFAISDRVIVMDAGNIIADETPQRVSAILKALNHDMYEAMPAPMRVYGAVDGGNEYPVTVRDARRWLNSYSAHHALQSELIPKIQGYTKPQETVIELNDVWFRYEKNEPDIIKGMNVKIGKGELFVIAGGNAAGKTTALSLMSGINVPYRGKVLIKGKNPSQISNLYSGVLGVLPQNPQTLFAQKSVYLDLTEMISGSKIPSDEKNRMVKDIAALCRIETLLDNHPYDLSGGEQQRAALAKVLMNTPEILLLDEPTKGMDAHFKREFADILMDLKANGVSIVMVSHDIEFCAEYADRCALIFDGGITSVGVPREFFAGKSFYTTSANRMARGVLAGAVLADDIIAACGAKPQKRERRTDAKPPLPRQNPQSGNTIPKPAPTLKSKITTSKSTMASALLILFAIPLTIYAGVTLLESRKYYFISLLIILETLIPFCMIFEHRKPRAREVIVISVLCAIAVAGRAAFFMIPQFKPVAAIVIIAGACFGAETGFLVGAVTGFVSNFFFGQGPWAPWQMFAFGIIGFIAGIIFAGGILAKSKTALCIYGGIATFVIYGGIMNPASLIMWQENPTAAMFAAVYIKGLPYDLIHAASTVFFLWFISQPMTEKLERIKVKYGLIE